MWLALSGVATIGLLYGIYILVTKEKAPFKNPFTKVSSGFCQYSGFPLRYGSCGKEVVNLQGYLNAKIKEPRVQLKEDGKMGKDTLEALKRIEGISTVSKAKFIQFKLRLNPFK